MKGFQELIVMMGFDQISVAPPCLHELEIALITPVLLIKHVCFYEIENEL